MPGPWLAPPHTCGTSTRQDGERFHGPTVQTQLEADVHMLDCLNDEELSTLGELLQRIIDNTDTKLLDEEISERRKAIHEFLMLNHTDEEVRE